MFLVVNNKKVDKFSISTFIHNSITRNYYLVLLLSLKTSMKVLRSSGL